MNSPLTAAPSICHAARSQRPAIGPSFFDRVGLGVAFIFWLASLSISAADSPGYVVVVSAKTKAKPEWNRVVLALASKHTGRALTFEASVEEILPELRRIFPRHICFVAQPEEATREFVAQVHRLTRRLDDDPYTDCFWGIVTGYDAANALRIAQGAAPLTIRKVAAGTSIPLENCEEGVWYSEVKKNQAVRKRKGQQAVEERGPDDTTKSLVDWLNDHRPDLFVTSGHATARDWQIGYAYKNGSFRCENGKLYGLDTTGRRFPIESSNPKVYLPVGNCLMGHIDSQNAMALAFMNSAGVVQMIGYTVNTWYGYAGWGCLDYFLEQPGRFTLAEAFVANDQALVYRLVTYFPELLGAEIDPDGRTKAQINPGAKAQSAGLTRQDGRGLLYDRDVLAFYGDPAWEARLAATPSRWDQTLAREGDVWTLELKLNRGARSFQVVDPNGSQRGGRPVIEFLPCRVKAAEVLAGADLSPLITDDFVLMPIPDKCEPGQIYRVVFRAAPR
ncbi:MAG TPA: hypothetical protein VJA21_29560 [Verrucomicrobiae bacterium]